jgi:hypothetical protein
LDVVRSWFQISNAKTSPGANRPFLTSAIRASDGKLGFLRKFSAWVSSVKGLTPETAAAAARTALCQAALAEDLLEEGFHYVLTSRMQSDPIERKFGQYRQMSGGKFLVSVRNCQDSEKISLVRSALKAGAELADILAPAAMALEPEVQEAIESVGPDSTQLSPETREVAVFVAGFVGKKIKDKLGCEGCDALLFGNPSIEGDHRYTAELNRGGLKFPSQALADYVCDLFGLLDATSAIIRASAVSERWASKAALSSVPCAKFVPTKHELKGRDIVLNTVINIFWSNHAKITTEIVRKKSVKRVAARKEKKDKKRKQPEGSQSEQVVGMKTRQRQKK